MVPPADQDSLLLFLQTRVAQLRVEHEDLVERERVLRAQKLFASADAMKVRAQTSFKQFQDASRKLASYISAKQRGVKT